MWQQRRSVFEAWILGFSASGYPEHEVVRSSSVPDRLEVHKFSARYTPESRAFNLSFKDWLRYILAFPQPVVTGCALHLFWCAPASRRQIDNSNLFLFLLVADAVAFNASILFTALTRSLRGMSAMGFDLSTVFYGAFMRPQQILYRCRGLTF